MKEISNLAETKTDVVLAVGSAVVKGSVALAVSLLGIPHIGEVAAEIVGTLIPDLRKKRLVEFMEIFADEVKDLHADVREQKLKTEEFLDLLEDSMWQAARSLTRERKKQIASFLRHSLYHGELDHLQEKTLLSLLNELNNAQIIMLKYAAFHGNTEQRRAYYERHRDVLVAPSPVLGASDEDVDRFAVHRVYRRELQRLGLLQAKFKKPKKGELPEIDIQTGMVKEESLAITRLGHLLLRYIALDELSEANRSM